jgi:hypothetical protein
VDALEDFKGFLENSCGDRASGWPRFGSYQTRSGGLSGSPFEKSGGLLDLDKVAKLIIDACCTRQVEVDNSPHGETGLHHNDTLDYVRVLRVVGVQAL